MNLKALHTLFLSNPVVSTDSRNITPGCLFFALRGPAFDGNQFASSAVSQGARYAIVDDNRLERNEKFILVDNVLLTLQQLARYHREQYQMPVLGITGSNGKTTTKELINAVLNKKYRVVCSKGNLNNHIGVPLTLLQIKSDTDIAIIEMGANAPGEIAMLCEIARPDRALITSIGKAHLGGFGNFENIITTKKALYDFVETQGGVSFVNADDAILTGVTKGYNRILYGSVPEVKYQTRFLRCSPFLSAGFTSANKEFIVNTQLIGDYNYGNLQSAVAVGLEYHVDPQEIVGAIEAYEPNNNRSQKLSTGKNVLILDAYNANPTSMKAALESFLKVEGKKKAVILGDMLELGDYEEDEHRQVLQWLELHPELAVYLIGPVFSRLNTHPSFIVKINSEAMRAYLENDPLKDCTILIKGSRGIAVEQVLDAL
jgi:UDP-N-acetylmuramoyl-tripeptide--D-alanyl-D-alanine ligase